MGGRVSHLAGLAAEDQVARLYERAGRPIRALRWRGTHGEIDIVARDGDDLVFVEVKHSHSHDAAAAYLTEAKMRRVYETANEYLATVPTGLMTPSRFDVALVDGMGRIEVIENAYAA